MVDLVALASSVAVVLISTGLVWLIAKVVAIDKRLAVIETNMVTQVDFQRLATKFENHTRNMTNRVERVEGRVDDMYGGGSVRT